MLKNKKGTTLLEVIITVSILAIAGLMLTTAFSHVVRNIMEANLVKDTSNELFEYLEQDKENTYVSTQNDFVLITLNDGTTIKGASTFKVASKEIYENHTSYRVSLSEFVKTSENVELNAKGYYNWAKNALEEAKADPSWVNVYNNKLEELKQKNSIGWDTYPSLSQDAVLDYLTFPNYLYIVKEEGTSYPKLSPNVIAKANDLYDRYGSKNEDIKNVARVGNKELYFKCVYVKGAKDTVLLVAEEGSNEPKPIGNKVRFIYNHKNDSWYYKVPSISEKEDIKQYYYNVEGLKEEDLEVLFKQFNDLSKWRRIDVD